ncbi:MAG: peptide ABC transporter ATP-binding protein [Anaerolineales bacterium]|nr:MAG: peptide ABC transporter ATP-binding protein [Anaerolineales bacterium]
MSLRAERGNLLTVKDLNLEFKTSRGVLKALSGISFEVRRGEVFGIVGETGCGKTVTGLSVLRLLPRSAKITNGLISFDGKNLLDMPASEMEQVRGGKIAMIFQDPSSSLNPVFTVGSQIMRVIRLHTDLNKKQAEERASETLTAVGLPDVRRIMNSYPHQLSGGQQQRVMIAMALSCRPQLLVADEPTTALDVTIQAQILKLLRDLQKQFDISVILITHNLGVVAQTCDRLAVLYAGRVAEIGSAQDIFNNPQHPYTRGLMNAIPKPGSRGKKMAAIPGTVPSNPGMVKGCPFADRCEFVFERCTQEAPSLFDVSDGHQSACFLVTSAG